MKEFKINKLESLDKNLLLALIFFLGFGLIQVYSSSYIFATQSYGSGLFFFKKQLFFTLIGALSLSLLTIFPWTWIEKGTLWIGFLGTLGLILTLLPEIGFKAGGAYRWIEFPFLNQKFEPGESLKLFLPLLMAHLISKHHEYQNQKASGFKKKYNSKYLKKNKKTHSYSFHSLLLPLLFISTSLFILLFQPDFGTFVLCLLTIFGMLFGFGLKWFKIGGLILIFCPLFYFLVMKVPYRYNRILSFLNPWEDPDQKGFQVIQSLLTIRSGGLFGSGLGLGQGKLFFLPAAHTDFTLAVLAEELGFIGLIIIFCLYAYIFLRSFKIAINTKRIFPKAFAFGFTLMMALSVLTHIGVVLGLLPTKGLTLAFLSYGGSSLLTTCIGFGLLLNLSHSQNFLEKKVFFPIPK